ncbi:nuclear pore complex protein Nup214 [Rhodotorula toruloides]|uniref:Nuclear pore complex protein Nup214 n=1 Tax=Rhodotorula toruloides TaxID=5286 RepID=A0A511KMW6_RHOTO|nr:nuclear pore complex protein Nup214 [Rhodotorula toruloides]
MEAPEEDAEFLSLSAPVQGVTLRLSQPFDLDNAVGGKAEPGNLLAVSNEFGWVVAARSEGGFALFSLQILRSTIASASPHTTPNVPPTLSVSTSAPVDFLRFAMGEKIVVAGLRDGSVAIWRLKSLVEGNTEPLRTIPAVAPSPLLDVCPNPAPESPLLAIISPSAPMTVFNIESSSVHATFSSSFSATSGCWSVKGKQIAIGTRGGTLLQLTPEGEQKASLGLPSDLATQGGEWEVRSVEWLENNVFLVTYGRPRTTGGEEPQHEDEVLVLTKGAGGAVEYARFTDPAPPFGMMGRRGRRWLGRFKNWEPFKHLLFMANAPSGDIGVIGQSATASYPPGSSSGWATLAVPESSRPTLPLGEAGEDACPLSLDLDLSAPDEGGSQKPAVLVYTSQGIVAYWRVTNDKCEIYAGLVSSRDVLTQEGGAPSTATTAAAPAPAAPSGFAAFGTTSAATSAASAAPSAFSTFSTPSSTPAFGASAFGSTPASTVSAFGTAATPAFGSSAGFGAFSKPSASTPVTSPFTTALSTGGGFASVPSTGGFTSFGSGGSAFGPAAPTMKTASPFGSGSAFGAGGCASKPVFGSTSTPTSTGGGASGFAAFGAAAGAGAATSAFGAFGGKPSVFGGAVATPSTPSTSTFGSGGTAPKFSLSAVPSTVARSPFATRQSADSDNEDEMADEEGAAAESRVDEPPDLEPIRTGLDFADSVREAEMKPSTPTAREEPKGPEGLSFGGFGLGSSTTTPSTDKPATSIFGLAGAKSTPPATAASKTHAFGGFGASSMTAPIFGGGGFAFGQKPAAPADAKNVEAPAAAETEKVKPTTGFGPFSASTGGFRAFASQKVGDTEAPKSAFGFGGSTPTSGGFGASETKKDEPGPGPKQESPAVFTPAPPDDETSTSASNTSENGFSFAPATNSTASAAGIGALASSKPSQSTSTASETESAQAKSDAEKEAGTAKLTAPPAKPASAFGAGGIASPAPLTPTAARSADAQEEKTKEEERLDQEEPVEEEEEEGEEGEPDEEDEEGADAEETVLNAKSEEKPKPAFSFAAPAAGSAGTGGFPKPASPGGFGPFASSTSTTGFGFGSAATTPKTPATSFSFGGTPAAAPASSAATGFSFAPAKSASPASAPFSFAPGASPKPSEPIAVPSPKEEKSTTKSLFGFASSPPDEKKRGDAAGSLLSRMSGKEEQPADEEEETEKEEERHVAEESDEGEGELEEESSEGGAEQPASSAPSAPSSLLSRLSPAPPSPAAEPATSAFAPTVKAPTFSFASPATPASPTPAVSASKSPFNFAAPRAAPSPATSTPPASPPSFLNFSSSTPKASSPLAAPPLGVPAFPSAAPKVRSPLSLGPTAPKLDDESSPTSARPSSPASTATPFCFGAAPTPVPASVRAADTKSISAPTRLEPAPPVSEPAPSASVAVAGPRQRTPLAGTAAPKLGTHLLAAEGAAAPSVEEKGMAGEFLKAYLSVQQDFEILRKNAAIIKDFVADLSKPCQSANASKDKLVQYDDKFWSFGDLEQLKHLTKDAKPSVESLHIAAISQKRRAAELESQLLKAEMKREEAARLIRARSDPAFAKMIRVRQLGPEQMENQRKIRLQMQAAIASADQLEEHLLSLKKRVTDEKLGRQSFQAPSLDSVGRALRNISLAVTEKTLELDGLTMRLNSVRLQPASNATPRRKLLQRTSSLALDEPLQRSPASRQLTSAGSSSNAVATAEAALQAERSGGVLKQALLAARRDQPLLNRSACGSQTARVAKPAADIQLAFSQGPITGERLPRPRRFVPPPPATPSNPSAPTTPVSTFAKVVKPFVATPSAPVASSLPPLSPFATSTPVSSSLSATTSTSFPSSASSAAPSASKPTFRLPSALSASTVEPPAFPPVAPAPAMPLFAAPMASAGLASVVGALATPPPVFPSLTLKAAPQISFATPASAPSPASTSNTSPAASSRGSASRQTSSRHHPGAVQLKPATGQPTPAASTFDWGPLPSSLTNGTVSNSSTSMAPAKPAAPSSFSFGSTNSAATPSKPGAPLFSFASSASTATPTKPAVPNFSFASTTPAQTPPSKPLFPFATTTPAGTPTSKTPFSFVGSGSTAQAVASTAEAPDEEEEERFDEEEDEEDWEGEDGDFSDEEYDEDEEGLDTISEANEEEDE